MADLALTPVDELVSTLGGRQASILHSLAKGHDPSPISPSGVMYKSMSDEDSFQSCSTR